MSDLAGVGEIVPVDQLSTYFRNPRRGNVEVIAESLAVTGQYRPIVVNVGNHTGRPLEVLAGNHTLLAARSLGWSEISCWQIDVDDQTAARIVAADNRTADLGEYDDELLGLLLSELDDLAGTGYTEGDLAELLGLEVVGLTDEDEAPDLPVAPRSSEGDIWLLGPHRVICGSSTDPAVLEALLGDERADVVWTDPPYGVSYVGGTGKTIQNDDAAGLSALLDGAFRQLAAFSRPGAPVYIAHADTARVTFETSAVAAGLVIRQNLVWVKNALVLGRSDYQWQHEPILYGAVDGALEPDYAPEHEPVLYGFAPGGKGRLGRGGPRWHGDNSATTTFFIDKPKRSEAHPTMKPVALIEQMLGNSAGRGALVLDLFGGSGSTLIAARRHGSRARLVELDPAYVDVICRRWQEHTGELPVLAATGETHDFSEEA